MTQADRAQAFRALHQKGNPLVLYNIWDAGSAKAVADAGALALATGSWSVAAAQGYADGEEIPLDLLVTIVERITSTVDLPLSVDVEGGYASEPEGVEGTIRRIISAGAVGVNFEDRVVKGQGLHPISLQSERVAAVRAAGETAGIPIYINARTDLFLEAERSEHAGLVEAAIERGAAYEQAGADGLFVPGLVDPALISQICADSGLPVNVMMTTTSPSTSELAELGVARISHGPNPYRKLMATLATQFLADTQSEM